MAREKIAGVYKITNTVNGKVYVGSSLNLHKRGNQHFNALRKGIHYNPKLQRAFNKHGESSFVYEILEVCSSDAEMLMAREQHHIDTLMSVDRGYNVLPKAYSNSGHKYSEEAKKKISNALMGHGMPEHVKEKLLLANKGSKHSEEHKKKISDAMKGREFSEQHHQRLSESQKGNKKWLGKKHSEQTILKMREAQRLRFAREKEASNGN